MKKTVIFKTAFAAILIVLAFSLVTCELVEPPVDSGGDGGFTDVVYEYTGTSKDIRIKSVKLYLDGKKVPRTAEQRKLDLEAARMGHDFFEVVFWGGTGTSQVVARTTWEIGQQAGISGVYRNPNGTPTPGCDYASLAPLGTGTASTGSSAVFVGKKSSKTLLGVGYLSDVNDNPGTLIDSSTVSVTFTVSPLTTWLGFRSDNNLIFDNDPDVTTAGVATFMTAAGGTGGAPDSGVVTYPAAAANLTRGGQKTLRTGAIYPQFDLPSVRSLDPAVTSVIIPATYTIGGLVLPAKDLRDAVRTWGMIGGTAAVDGTSHTTSATPGTPVVATTARGGLQFIKRTPAFLYQGTTYGLPSNDDKITKVVASPTIADAAFVDVMNITITQTRQSNGVFAITFQQPVYLLTVRTSNNTASGVKAEKWFVRPDYGQYQYMLDNGVDSGGAVLLATDLVSGGGEWIEIKTTGIGFDNE